MTFRGQVRPGFIEEETQCQTLGLGRDGGDKELEMTIDFPSKGHQWPSPESGSVTYWTKFIESKLLKVWLGYEEVETIIDWNFSECFYFGDKETKEDDMQLYLRGEVFHRNMNIETVGKDAPGEKHAVSGTAHLTFSSLPFSWALVMSSCLEWDHGGLPQKQEYRTMGKNVTGRKHAVSGYSTLYLLKAPSKIEGQQQRKWMRDSMVEI